MYGGLYKTNTVINIDVYGGLHKTNTVINVDVYEGLHKTNTVINIDVYGGLHKTNTVINVDVYEGLHKTNTERPPLISFFMEERMTDPPKELLTKLPRILLIKPSSSSGAAMSQYQAS